MNFPSFIILMLLMMMISLVIYTMIQDKKKGRLCGGHCSSCGSYSLCQQEQSLYKEYKKEKS